MSTIYDHPVTCRLWSEIPGYADRCTCGLTPEPTIKTDALTVRSVDGSPCVFIAEINGREVGRMSITVLPLVHDMEIPASPIQRKITDALFFYASGKVKAAGFSEAVVCVANTNEKMQRYVEQRAVKEEDSAVYMMGVS